MAILIFSIPLIWWTITIILPILSRFVSGKPFPAWVGYCAQISVFTLIYLAILEASLRFALMSPLLVFGVLFVVLSKALFATTWLLLPCLAIGGGVFLISFIGLKRFGGPLRNLSLLLALLAMFSAALFVGERISQTVMQHAAAKQGGEITQSQSLLISLRQSAGRDSHTPHATLRIGATVYHWSYSAKAFIDPMEISP